MEVKVATTLDEIIEGWRLVYHQYVATSLIDVNPFSIFTFPEYISRNAAVILAQSVDESRCTLSAVLDSKKGLPLDAYFKKELDELRGQKKKLMEIGLLACSHQTIESGLTSKQLETVSPMKTAEQLSSVARFGIYSHYHDYVIGVHPRRTEFFIKLFGFRAISESKIYHRLRKSDVVLLYADGKDFETLLKKASHDVYNTPTNLRFDQRFQFTKRALSQAAEAGNYFVSFVKKLHDQFLAPTKLATSPKIIS